MKVPSLETDRLTIRPLLHSDLQRAFEIIDCDWIGSADPQDQAPMTRRDDWLRWTIFGYEQQAQLGNPPYGERAVVLRSEDRLIGLCGLVPSFGPFGRIIDSHREDNNSPAVGLFYCMDSTYRRQGYATEAARALMDFACGEMKVRRVVATTERDNDESIGVMRRLGFTIYRNSESGWPEVVGSWDND